jgi:hypothetical protein
LYENANLNVKPKTKKNQTNQTSVSKNIVKTKGKTKKKRAGGREGPHFNGKTR